MGWRGVLNSFLFVVASAAYGTDGKYLFHLPWACAVLHEERRSLVGACAILNAKNVLVSVDNFNDWIPTSHNPRRYFEAIDELSVFAGTNYMNPNLHGTSHNPNLPDVAQRRKVDKLFIGKNHRYSQTDRAERWDYIETPVTEIDGQVPQDLYGVAFNIGILRLVSNPFTWTAYVRPVTVNYMRDLEDESKGYLQFISRNKSLIADHLCITYSWNERKNKIRYHTVSFLPNEYCMDAFCGWNFSTCDRFPKKDYLVCYKSTTFADVCPNARGAALYCPTLFDSVYGILTTAPSCGRRHMPGVYTMLHLAIRLYESVYNTTFSPEKDLQLDDPFKLDQKDTDYEGVL